MQKDIQNTKDHIVYLGENGFPFGLGAIQRMLLVAKSLHSAGVQVTVICRKGVWQDNEKQQFIENGIFEGIHYIYTSTSVYRPKSFIKRNFEKLKGMYGEYKYLRNLKKCNNITAAIISNMSAFHVMRYRIYANLIGFPLVLNFVELGSAMKGREKWLTKLNDYIFDHHIIRIVDAALPISNKLMDYYKRLSPKKPFLKLPILCDFRKFNLTAHDNEEIVFLYCGAASYFELIDFVLDAFDKIELRDKQVIFELILGGSEAELNKVIQRIDISKNKKCINLISNVDHQDIPGYFTNASALLIPLRPSVQDEARFPHKIGEYLASGRPMITTCFGEIKNYNFIDGNTALIAEEYEVGLFAEKMQFILDNPVKSKEIGIKGRQMGLENFDYTKHGQILKQFIRSIGQFN